HSCTARARTGSRTPAASCTSRPAASASEIALCVRQQLRLALSRTVSRIASRVGEQPRTAGQTATISQGPGVRSRRPRRMATSSAGTRLGPSSPGAGAPGTPTGTGGGLGSARAACRATPATPSGADM
ncbi:Methylthioribose-1-phosphate isomerase, partial [Frankliniella fusca]